MIENGIAGSVIVPIQMKIKTTNSEIQNYFFS